MLVILLRIFEHALIGACLSSLSLFFFSLVALLRLLPGLLRFIHVCLRSILILSYRLYRLVLMWLDRHVQHRLGLTILSGYLRVIACLVLSLLLGALILLVTDLPFPGWIVGLSVIHGLIVGLAWDELEDPGGLQLGVKMR